MCQEFLSGQKYYRNRYLPGAKWFLISPQQEEKLETEAFHFNKIGPFLKMYAFKEVEN